MNRFKGIIWGLVLVLVVLCSCLVFGSRSDLSNGMISCYNLSIDGKDFMNNGIASQLSSGGSPSFVPCLIGDCVQISLDNRLRNDSINSTALQQVRSISMWQYWDYPLVNKGQLFNLEDSNDVGGNTVFLIRSKTNVAPNNNTWMLWYNNPALIISETSEPIPVKQWINYVAVFNEDGNFSLYINAEKVYSVVSTATLSSSFNMLSLGRGATYDTDASGRVDELMFFDYVLSEDDINDIYNNQPSCNLIETSGAVESGELDLIFYNKSGVIKSVFDEGEDFGIYVNFSRGSDGSVVSDGFCNVSVYGGLYESNSILDNFSLCGSGCDFVVYNESFDLHDNVSVLNDSVHFKACFPQTPQESVLINLSCRFGSESFVLLPEDTVSCDSVSIPPHFFVSDVCIDSLEVNVSLSYDGTFNRRKIISDLAVNREYSIHLNENGSDVFFNSSIGLYEVTHNHEFYVHGSKTVTANCSHSEPELISSRSESITIVNVLPSIFVDGVLINETIYPFTSSIPYRFFNEWIFLSSVTDNNLVSLNITLYNGSGVVYSVVRSVNFRLNASSSDFRDFGSNPFNLSILATDDEDSVFYSVSFNVSDTVNPFCSGLFSRSVDNGTNLSFDVVCQDESLYFFNLSCSTGISNVSSGMNTNYYVFDSSYTIINESYCLFEVCDGHTSDLLSKDFFVSKGVDEVKTKNYIKGKPKNNTFRVVSGLPYELSYVKEKDRVRIKVDFDVLKSDKKYKYEFYYFASPNSHYFVSDKYKGWIVDGDSRTWFDTNLPDDPFSVTTVEEVDDGVFRVNVETVLSSLYFESIGNLNCISGDFTISLNRVIDKQVFPTELSTAILYIFLLVFWVGMLIVTLTFKGVNGKTIGFFNIFQMVLGIVAGIVWMPYFFLIGFPVIFIGVGFFLALIWEL